MTSFKEFLKSEKAIKSFAMCGIVLPIIYFTVINILAALRPDYDRTRLTISHLGAEGSPNADFASALFIVAGILTILFAIGLYHGIEKEKGYLIGPIILIIFGLFDSIGSGVFPCDADCAIKNFSGRMHILVSFFGMIAMCLSNFFLSRDFKKDVRWQGYDKYALIMGIIIFILWGIFIYFISIMTLIGLFQRIIYYIFLSWILILGVKLYRLY